MKTVLFRYPGCVICEVDADTNEDIVAAVLNGKYEILHEDAGDITEIAVEGDDGDYYTIPMNF